MSPDRLITHFEQISEAPDAVPRLRRFILDLAVRGKLVEQDPADEPAAELLKHIEKADKSFEIPSTWISAKAGQLLNMQYGKALPASDRSDHGTIPVFGSNGVVSYCETALSQDPAIIIGRKGSAGALHLCDGPSWTTDVAYFLVPSPVLNIRFLLVVLKTLDLGSLGKGVKPGLSRSEAYQLPIIIPPLAEQLRIVAKVDELMALCDELEAAQTKRERRRDRLVAATMHGLNNGDAGTDSADGLSFAESARFFFNHLPRLTTRPEHIRQLRQSILNLAVRGKLVPQDAGDEPAAEVLKRIMLAKKQLSRGSRTNNDAMQLINDEQIVVPLGWQTVRFQNILLTLQTGPFGSSLHQHDYEKGGIPVVNPASIQNERIVSIEKMAVGQKTLERLATFKLRKNDIVMGRRGEMGRCAVVTEKEEGWLCGTGSLILRFTEEVSPRFVVKLMSAPSIRKYLGGASVGATMQNLNQSILCEMPVGLPPLAEQYRIVDKVDELMALCDDLETRLTTTATTLRQLLDASLQKELTP